LLTFAADGARLSTLALDGRPYGLAYDAGHDVLHVTLTERNEVVALDLSGSEPVEISRLPTVRQPNTVAVDPASGRVYVASRSDGTLQIIDR
jgi:DNA-binding beta-propeller fold protein YncE